jgi:phage terminase large subunit-like protein
MSLNVETDRPAPRRRARKLRPAPPAPPLPPRDGNARAEKVITFIQALTIPSGIGEGQPFMLMDWQQAFIRDIYTPHVGNRRIVRRAILSIARKNGKTALIAAIVLAHLVGPEATANGEIYSAANDRDQAAIVFKFAKQLVERDANLRRLIEVISSTKTMLARRTGSIYRAISAEAGTKHGYLPSVVIYDELAQSKGRELYDVLDTSFGSRSEPLFITISTQSNDPEHTLSRLIDDGLTGSDPSIICHLHAADEDCDLEDEAQWRKANPALGVFRDLEDLRTSVFKAKRLPAEEPKVRNLLLNQRVSPVSTLIARADWMACAGEVSFKDGEEIYLALDLSAKTDLTALVMGSASDPCRIVPFFWKPADSLHLHSNRDFGTNSGRYRIWADEGHLLLSPGQSINPEMIATKIAELHSRYNVLGLAYDRWRMDTLLREFDRIGLASYRESTKESELPRFATGRSRDGIRIVEWGQGFRDMAPAVEAFEAAIKDRKLVHPNNPVLNWNIGNAVASTDPSGNRKLDKEKARFRIDGAVALTMMLGLRARDRQNTRTVDIETLIG